MELRDEVVQYRVSSANLVSTTNQHVFVHRFAIRNPGGMYCVREFFPTLGIGYHGLLQQVTEHWPSPTGGELKAEGQFTKALHGSWSLEYEADSGYLVRKAAFTPSGGLSPSFFFRNSGLSECAGLRLATAGTFTSPAIRYDFNVLAVTNLAITDALFRTRVDEFFRHIDSSLPTNGATVLDNRGSELKRIEH
jgi:hypothetical protein